MKALKYIGMILILTTWLIISLIVGVLVGLFLGYQAWSAGIEKYINLHKLKAANNGKSI